MDNHIQNLMKESLDSIKEMISGNKVLSEPLMINGKMIITVSKIKIGFASGGTEQKSTMKNNDLRVPFGGGAGGNLSITPIAFLVVDDNITIHHLDDNTHLLERIIDKFKPETNDMLFEEEIVKVSK